MKNRARKIIQSNPDFSVIALLVQNWTKAYENALPIYFLILTEGLRDFPHSHSRYSHLARAWSQDQKNNGGIQIRKPFSLLIKGNATKISNKKVGLEQTTMKENMTLMKASMPK